MKIVIAGNPNIGKTTIVNLLTGLNLKTSNIPGTTVEIHAAKVNYKGNNYEFVDLPGAYDLSTETDDEKVATEILLKKEYDLIIYVADFENLRRNLFYFTKLIELNKPIGLILHNTTNLAQEKIKGIEQVLSSKLDVLTTSCNGRDKTEKNKLFSFIQKKHNNLVVKTPKFNSVAETYAWLDQTFGPDFKKITKDRKRQRILDKYFLHPIWGTIIFFLMMIIVFQSVFTIADYPMQWIESIFGLISSLIDGSISHSLSKSFLNDGLIPGISTILIFLPQIVILFFFISLMEETGYMTRVSFMTDWILRKFGMNGRSVVPLVGGMACAIPSIMAARTIKNKKEKLITILVTPLMACSARLPVYALLMAVIIPKGTLLGFIDYRGLALFAMYAFGLFTALIVGFILKKILKSNESSVFMLEMPMLRKPLWKNIFYTMYQKSASFVLGAGKVIIIISVLLWGLAQFGPKNAMAKVNQKYELLKVNNELSDSLTLKYKSEKLGSSFAGQLGKVIEPAIKPLGYDWKTGIGLISSFAAREVFVSTMATLFSLEDGDDNVSSLRDKMAEIKNPDGTPKYGMAYAMSLMMFFAIAMQCMGTLAVVRKETGGWKWPLVQFLYMGILAYLVAFITFWLFS